MGPYAAGQAQQAPRLLNMVVGPSATGGQPSTTLLFVLGSAAGQDQNINITRSRPKHGYVWPFCCRTNTTNILTKSCSTNHAHEGPAGRLRVKFLLDAQVGNLKVFVLTKQCHLSARRACWPCVWASAIFEPQLSRLPSSDLWGMSWNLAYPSCLEL